MAERIIIGKRGTETGMWVSRPGKSALSTNPSDLLLDTTTTSPRVIRTGTITNPVLNLTSSSAPNKSNQTSIPAIIDKTSNNTQVFNVEPAYWYSRGSTNDDGYALYTKDYYFNQDKSSLGYRPLAHISIGFSSGNTSIGDNYPKVFIDDTKITLSIFQNWDGTKSGWYKKSTVTQYYPRTVVGPYNALYWDRFNGNPPGTNGVYKSDTLVLELQQGPQPASTIVTNCIIHYAIYNRAMTGT